MAHQVADRVRETSTSVGTGAITLAGTVAGFRTFASALAVNDTTWYAIIAADGTWEVGLGTLTASTTLARTTVISSSNAGALVNFAAGGKDVFTDLPAPVFAMMMDHALPESSVASAATVDLGAQNGRDVVITGTTAITSFGTRAGVEKLVRFSGALTLTHNATTLALPSAANIVTQAGDCAFVTSDASGNFRVNHYQRADGTALQLPAVVPLPRGHLSALTLANNATDATNDIDVAAGKARADSDAADLVLASGLTKALDAAWVAGTGGGRDTGAIADGTWHVWLIGRTDGTARDVLFSLSATTPTMPSGYSHKRRIGSVLRAAGVIRPFVQTGDRMRIKTAVSELNISAARAYASLTLAGVPVGVRIYPLLFVSGQQGSSGGSTEIIAGDSDAAAEAEGFKIISVASAFERAYFFGAPVLCGLSANINFAVNVNAGTLNGAQVNTQGWLDRRGQDD